MARRVFFSFHYAADAWRAAQVRNMGVVEGNKPVSDNDWEAITRGGDDAIKKWIDEQLAGKSCAVVLIGEHTAGRKWIKYEVQQAWSAGKGIVGVYIHNLKNQDEKQSSKGRNPFEDFTLGPDHTPLSDIVRAYDPPYVVSSSVYSHIKENPENWVEEGIGVREDN